MRTAILASVLVCSQSALAGSLSQEVTRHAQHAQDENLRIGHFLSGTEIVYSLLTTPYR